MASTYRTPGTYVEEISKFPPSIASVETAIPAFIGYTERAKKKVAGDLLRKPVRISAIADYELFFGGPDMETGFNAIIKDEIDTVSGLLSRTVTVPKPAVMSNFLLCYSVRLYFANGGGPCYIISVGNYKDAGGSTTTISVDDLGNNSAGNGGLDVLEYEDEPTLILFPDAQALAPGKYFSLCQAALSQCNKLQDRFAILDTHGHEDTAPSLFRNSIGTDYLKYGAVYYPFLETSFNYAYRDEDVSITQTMASILNSPTATLADINIEKVKIEAVNTAIIAVDVTTPAAAVTGAGSKAARLLALPNVKTATDQVKVQVDLLNTALQTLITKAQAFNAGFMDPDITTALSNIDSMIYGAYSTSLGNISQSVTDALANPAPLSNNDLDAIANNLTNLVSNAGGTKDLLENLTDLKDNLIPALVTAVQGNDPASMITQVNTGYSDAKAAKSAIETIQTSNLVAAVTGAGVTDANALTALQTTTLKPGNVLAITQLGLITTSLNNILAAIKNASQIPFLGGLLSSVKPISLTTVDALKGSFTALDASITAATNVTPRIDLNKMATDFGEAMSDLETELNQVFLNLVNLVNAINYLNINGKKLSEIKQTDNNSFNQVKLEIEKIPVKLPPCSAMAGKYAQVDRDRGVWKAPANVSLASVIGPTMKVNNDIQDGLNIDPVAGKSVNVIRSFNGKGTMVWGARTLSGNDNEWRYVPVRRFFIYAEESIKKACDLFVFEPNDANTWVKVRAMIENWLVLQWRAGALAGAKPDDAFYVHIGLGQTMTAVDILEGRMNVEIGMAVVRPAEFIILKFSHKMQES